MQHKATQDIESIMIEKNLKKIMQHVGRALNNNDPGTEASDTRHS